MGPEATVLLMQKLLAAVSARDDADHIPLIVHQNPAVPSRIKRLIEGSGGDPAPVLAQMARDLAAAGAHGIAMPCNTAHAYSPQIVDATPLPFLDMRQATFDHLRSILPAGSHIGVLASPAVRMAQVFDAWFAKFGFVPVYLLDDAQVLSLIRQVKSGDTGPKAHAQMERIANMLAAKSDHLVVACTDLSLLTSALASLSSTDSLDCLTARIINFAKSS